MAFDVPIGWQPNAKEQRKLCQSHRSVECVDVLFSSFHCFNLISISIIQRRALFFFCFIWNILMLVLLGFRSFSWFTVVLCWQSFYWSSLVSYIACVYNAYDSPNISYAILSMWFPPSNGNKTFFYVTFIVCSSSKKVFYSIKNVCFFVVEFTILYQKNKLISQFDAGFIAPFQLDDEWSWGDQRSLWFQRRSSLMLSPWILPNSTTGFEFPPQQPPSQLHPIILQEPFAQYVPSCSFPSLQTFNIQPPLLRVYPPS